MANWTVTFEYSIDVEGETMDEALDAAFGLLTFQLDERSLLLGDFYVQEPYKN